MRKKVTLIAFPFVLIVGGMLSAGVESPITSKYEVLEPVTVGALTVFPVTGQAIPGAEMLLTLDEGIRSGEVIVTEQGSVTGLRRHRPGVWTENSPAAGTAQVNQLTLVNNSKRPLVLLAGEIVSGGKQDRVVGKDRIVGPESEVALGVFCVEPHRWNQVSENFNPFPSAMVQPSVRQQAMAGQNQQGVWDQVARARSSIKGVVPTARTAIDASSSYAQAVETAPVKREMEATVMPIEQRFQSLGAHLRERKALGAVVAVNGRIVWADVFASPGLFNKYWPKLVRSYAAEAMSNVRTRYYEPKQDPRAFLNNLAALRETSESEPNLFRNTQLTGNNFEAFILTALLPGTGYNVHLTKMAKF
jgi:hypothetical protein